MASDPALWRRIFAPFAVGYFLSYLLRNANAVISPELTAELGLTAADLGLLTSAYLLTFALFQLPLGLLLDRYGPRRVEAALLLVCAAGCLVFALGQSMPQLTFGRALIGLGVSACLMAGFKVFSLWFPPERQASLNAAIMAAGGLGALAASSPLGALLPLLGWRGIFIAMAALSIVVAVLIWHTPEKAGTAQGDTLREQLAGMLAVYRSRLFWRFAPLMTFMIGGFIAVQGLWAVPWLMTVDGLGRDAAAFHLFLMACAQLTGFLGIAFFVQRMARAGFPPERLLRVGTGGGLLAIFAIAAGLAPTWLLWPALGLVFSVGNLSYALLTTAFPKQLAGRANSALNLGVFVGAFVIQWLFGVAVDAGQAAGLDATAAYRASLAALLTLQATSWAWFVREGRRTAPC